MTDGFFCLFKCHSVNGNCSTCDYFGLWFFGWMKCDLKPGGGFSCSVSNQANLLKFSFETGPSSAL